MLQNLIEPKTNKSRVLPREEVINYIKKYSKGIRLDLIDEIAEYNKYSLAKSRFFEIYGKLKGTKDISREEESIILKTVKDGDDIDYERIKKFELLLNELVFFNV